MIIRLDHYRKSNTRAMVESYYSRQQPEDAAPKQPPAKILYTPWHAAPRVPDSAEDVTTPETC